MPHSPEHFQNLRNALQAELLRYFDSTLIGADDCAIAFRGEAAIRIPITDDHIKRSFGTAGRLKRQVEFLAQDAAIRFDRGERL